ncbi:hypothetical protein BUGL105410_37705 [Burkholderia gladioli]
MVRLFRTFSAVALGRIGSTGADGPPCTDDAPNFAPLALPLSLVGVSPGTDCPGSRPSGGIDALPAVLLTLTPVPEIVPFELSVEK